MFILAITRCRVHRKGKHQSYGSDHQAVPEFVCDFFHIDLQKLVDSISGFSTIGHHRLAAILGGGAVKCRKPCVNPGK